jgi:hypothetical protein
MTSFSDIYYRIDGKSLFRYSWQWDSRPYPGTFNPRVVIHETGHALGLPDYYDYDGTVGPGGGVGGLDMMDSVWGDHNCFSKLLLDWISPQVYNLFSRRVTLGASGNTQDAVLAMPEFNPDSPYCEFFMVQNRFRLENDQEYPANGLLVWHIDARLNSQGSNFRYDNSYTSHKLLRLMEADGLEEIERGGIADAGDYYVAGREFNPSTFPNSNRYDGTSTGMTCSSISPSGLSMSFFLAVNYTLYPPLNFSVNRLANDFVFFKEYINRLTWASNPDNRTQITHYLLYKKLRGQSDDCLEFLAQVSPGIFYYEHRGLKTNEFYTYRIIAVDRNGMESQPGEVSN